MKLYIIGNKIKLDSIVEWKRICEDPDEFLEVRRVNWDWK